MINFRLTVAPNGNYSSRYNLFAEQGVGFAAFSESADKEPACRSRWTTPVHEHDGGVVQTLR